VNKKKVDGHLPETGARRCTRPRAPTQGHAYVCGQCAERHPQQSRRSLTAAPQDAIHRAPGCIPIRHRVESAKQESARGPPSPAALPYAPAPRLTSLLAHHRPKPPLTRRAHSPGRGLVLPALTQTQNSLCEESRFASGK
jgi:hypothetical protein